MMEKFVLVTSGRTGSTAVIDELGKASSLVTTQELFLRKINMQQWIAEEKLYKLLPRFDDWMAQLSRWKRKYLPMYSDARQAEIYLGHAEELAQAQGAKGFGWKVLSHHFEQRHFLGHLLKQRGYRALYLRRNPLRQALSGMVANQRGIFNSLKKIEDDHRYHIDLDELQKETLMRRKRVTMDCEILREYGLDYIEIDYEDYCENRESFYSKIFTFLTLPIELPPKSDFVKVIEDLRTTLENYDEVEQLATTMGESP